jgi:flagellar protein FlaI
MESVLINVDREKEALVPRPTPDADGEAEAAEILDAAEDIFETYRGRVPDSVADALLEMNPAGDVEATPAGDHETLAETAREADAAYEQPAGPEPAPSATDADDADGARPGAKDSGPSGTFSPDPAHGDFEGVSEAAGDGSGDRNGIDFGEPFDEGVDVLSSPAGPSEPGASGDAGAPAEGDMPVDGDGTHDVSEGFSAADPVESEPSVGVGDGGSDEPDGTAGTDGAVGDETDGGDGEASGAGDSDAAEAGDDDEGDESDDGSADDIDEWGFDAVEPAEDG